MSRRPTPTEPDAPKTAANDDYADLLDEHRAGRFRESLGRRGLILSWVGPHAGSANPWLARLSGPELPLTVERRGRSRCEAIRRAHEVWTLLQSTTD
jgi:hypothetical protein